MFGLHSVFGYIDVSEPQSVKAKGNVTELSVLSAFADVEGRMVEQNHQ